MYFLLLASSLGVGFAIDVAIVTISRFRDESLSFSTWTAPVAGFHIAFLTFSYFLSWSTVKTLPWLAPIVGVTGFALVGCIIFEVLTKAIGNTARFNLSERLESILPLSEASGNRTLTGIAISLDAFLGGPAVSMVATGAQWSLPTVCLSFVVVGVTVGLIAEGSLLAAKRFRRQEFHSVEKLCLWLIAGTYLEVTVLGGFGLLSLWGGVAGDSSLVASFVFSAVLGGLFFITYWSRILRTNYTHAKSSIEGRY